MLPPRFWSPETGCRLGGARVLGLTHKTLSEHWELCRAPVDGHFESRSTELFALATHAAPPEIVRLLSEVGWSPAEVDHYAFHQPSEVVLEQIISDLAARPEACAHTHALFGNTASTSWALALDYRLRHATVQDGDKIVMATAAAGFTMATAAAVWED